ncbi:MAG: FAD-dependent oxidoreductase [Lentisphaeria bacterium]|nr:FAD-dependent oxidoreductase [Lentisphaeria bacterium]
MSDAKHTIVLGSGIGGLSAAILLAKAGRRVTIIESNGEIGGRMRRFRRNGVPFDTGLHFTSSLNGILGQALATLGVLDGVVSEPFPWGLKLSDGHELRFPNTGRSDFYEYLAQEFPKEADALEKYRINETEVLRGTPMFDLRDSPGDPAVVAGEADQTTLKDFMEACGVRGPLATTLASPALYHGAPPSECPAARHFRICYGFEEQMQRLKGGGDTLCENFEKELNRLGIEVRLNTKVVKFGKFQGPFAHEAILSDGTALQFDDLFTSLHPAQMPELLPEEHSAAYRRLVSGLQDTCGFFTVFATVDDTLPLQQGLISALRDDNLDNVLSPAIAAPALSTGFAITKESDSHGIVRQCLILLAPQSCGNGEKPSDDAKAQMLETVLSNAKAAMPEIAANLNVICAATPHTYGRFIPPGRGAYGVMMKTRNPRLMGRTPIRNFYAIGESAFTPGIIGTLLTSFLTVRRVIGEEAYQALLPPQAFIGDSLQPLR